MARLFPPAFFGNVESQVYRSAFPLEVNFGFLQTLNLRTVIFLGTTDPNQRDLQAFSSFANDLSIRSILLNNPPGDGLDGGSQHLSEEMVLNALQALIEPSNHPVLLTCASGKYLTGAVIGCFRKMQHWSLASVFEEYRRFAGQRLHQEHEQFVELFDADLISVTPDSKFLSAKTVN